MIDVPEFCKKRLPEHEKDIVTNEEVRIASHYSDEEFIERVCGGYLHTKKRGVSSPS